MKNIKFLLLQPSLIKLKDGYNQLRRDIGFESSEEIDELTVFVNQRLQQVDALLRVLENPNLSASLEHALLYRNLKLELRFAQRRWQRMISTEIRLRKIHEKRPNVSTFAA